MSLKVDHNNKPEREPHCMFIRPCPGDYCSMAPGHDGPHSYDLGDKTPAQRFTQSLMDVWLNPEIPTNEKRRATQIISEAYVETLKTARYTYPRQLAQCPMCLATISCSMDTHVCIKG